MNERLMALEIKVAYLEKANDELSEVVRELYQKVAALSAALERLAESDQPGMDALAEERPPHY